jgi:hypothetical protein
MSEFDPSALFAPPKKSARNMRFAMILQMLLQMMEEEEGNEGTERERHEIPVRPRVEPLGGA